MKGPVLIGIAAFLWATDALFRFPSLGQLDPVFMVFSEHVLITACLLPWILARKRALLFSLNARQWIGMALVGAGGSAFATVLFTASFRLINPSVAILLQKIQPVMVVLIAYAALGERPGRRFYPWAVVALAASVVLSFPDFDFGFLTSSSRESQGNLHGILFTLGAAVLWAASTVIGRGLLLKLDMGVVSFWRFAFGLLALLPLSALSWGPALGQVGESRELQFAILYMAIGPGLLAMLFYYSGLAITRASVTTFVELIFPIAAVLMNAIVLKLPLSPMQFAAGTVLIISVWRIAREPEALPVATPAPLLSV